MEGQLGKHEKHNYERIQASYLIIRFNICLIAALYIVSWKAGCLFLTSYEERDIILMIN